MKLKGLRKKNGRHYVILEPPRPNAKGTNSIVSATNEFSNEYSEMVALNKIQITNKIL